MDTLIINPITGMRLKNSASKPPKSNVRRMRKTELEEDVVTLSGKLAQDGEDYEDDDEAVSGY